MAASKVTVGLLLDRLRGTLQLEEIEPGTGLDRVVGNPEVSSPGLVLAGYVKRFSAQRLQVLGETEITYLSSRSVPERRKILELFFSFPIPAVFVTKGQRLPVGLREAAAASGIPIIRTKLKTAEFYRRIKPVLEMEFAPTVSLHGSLADIFGVGLFFTGMSGIGKSECVLDLVERGHRLVADDLVIASKRGNDVLIGRGHEMQRHYMEIRGVGLIDIPAIFGIRAVRQQKRIEVVVQLEQWNQDAPVERTGLDVETTTILDVELPKITVYLNPGKNITVIAEVIALNHLLRYSGVDAAQTFNDRLVRRMKNAASTNVREYLQEDHE
ncbi:MAG TPA: HPr(Ser) kinase/phosphatase [Gemmatimonadaceae bacterium]|jgi:HPr kinase/phosphorylase|nr:HPr(Ser) kinase/phosphatase [Gemmatimonadaceae bacterium]